MVYGIEIGIGNDQGVVGGVEMTDIGVTDTHFTGVVELVLAIHRGWQ
jgi:hypothetical protein